MELKGSQHTKSVPARISVVTPTWRRAREVKDLLVNLEQQTLLPYELILVDAAADGEDETRLIVEEVAVTLSYKVIYIRRGGGTAIQRNVGIDSVEGEFIAFIDDDIRLESEYFAKIIAAFQKDTSFEVGGIAGCITNQCFDASATLRWQWYKRLGLFTTYEPGRYDYESGYPINRYMQPLHEGSRVIDFMGSNCSVWRAEVFAGGLRFSEFFRDYGMLEDAHMALRAGEKWKLLEVGSARCIHLAASGGRVNSRRWAYKTAVNYRYVFMDIVPNRSWRQEWRFWRVQFADLARFALNVVRIGGPENSALVAGKAQGIWTAFRMKQPASDVGSRSR